MRRRPLFWVLGALAAIVVIPAGLIAVPCETHHIILKNNTDVSASVRIIGREAAIWSGQVRAGERREVSLVSFEEYAYYGVQVQFLGGDRQELSGRYWFPIIHPYVVDADIRHITDDGLERGSEDHPLVDMFEFEYWKVFALAAVVIFQKLRCYDTQIIEYRRLRKSAGAS